MKFNEMEYHLPFEEGARALAEIIALLEKQFLEVYFPIEVRVVAPDDVWLSPFYKRPTCSIAIHHDAAEDPLPYISTPPSRSSGSMAAARIGARCTACRPPISARSIRAGATPWTSGARWTRTTASFRPFIAKILGIEA